MGSSNFDQWTILQYVWHKNFTPYHCDAIKLSLIVGHYNKLTTN